MITKDQTDCMFIKVKFFPPKYSEQSVSEGGVMLSYGSAHFSKFCLSFVFHL